MDRLLVSAIFVSVMLLAACEPAVETAPVPEPDEVVLNPAPEPEPVPEPEDDTQPAPAPTRPAPRAPDHVDLYWGELPNGGRVAHVCESDHVDQLPEDVEAVSLDGIRWGCWGRDYRVGDAEIERLKGFKQLKTLSVGVPISDAGFEAIAVLPALEELTLMSCYEVDARRLELLQQAEPLKTLTLYMSGTSLDEDALKAFRKARPDVKVVHQG